MRLDRQQAFSGTTEADLPLDRLNEYLRAAIPGFAGPLAARRFKGGQSNPTYLLEAASGRYVLRRKPAGKLLASAHAVEREFRVTRALHAQGFPVARPLVLCTDETVVGSVFYVMEHVEGRVFWLPHAAGIGWQERAQLFNALCDTLARLHRAPLAGLEDFGKPHGYVARQVKRWSEQYCASATRAIPAMKRLVAWLPDAVPQSADAAIVHGDYRLDNCIVAPDAPRIAAVLDWELATLGDPLADFTYHLMMWHMPVSRSGGGVGTLIGHENDPGIPKREAYIERYCQLTGRAAIPALPIYLAYNFFRIAAILQGIAGRVRDGTAANPNAAAVADEVEPLADTAWAFAKEAGA
jgi:aminoglycoside phosphotransferase (APT) family kinase protein